MNPIDWPEYLSTNDKNIFRTKTGLFAQYSVFDESVDNKFVLSKKKKSQEGCVQSLDRKVEVEYFYTALLTAVH